MFTSALNLLCAQRAKCLAPIAAIGILSTMAVIPPALAFDAKEKEEIGQIVREYLLANPELMIEVQQALEAKEAAQASARIAQTLSESNEALFNNPSDPVFGNSEGDVAVVEFFDYNCGFCRRGLPDMEFILANDKDVKFVLKEFPIFGPNSAAVHTVAIAFHSIAPEKYYDYHVKMLRQEGQIDESRALEIAEGEGIDMDALNAAMQNPGIIDSFRQTDALASGLGITGTPSYVIGDEVVVGALGKDVLIEKIDNYRKCGSTRC